MKPQKQQEQQKQPIWVQGASWSFMAMLFSTIFGSHQEVSYGGVVVQAHMAWSVPLLLVFLVFVVIGINARLAARDHAMQEATDSAE
jgi:hypothetical protein